MGPHACSECGLATAEVPLADAGQRMGAVTLRVSGVRGDVCPSGHVSGLGGLESRILQTLTDSLLQARLRRFGRRVDCGSCGAAMTLRGRATSTPVPVEFAAQVVTTELECTMVRCPDCGREQVGPEGTRAIAPLVSAVLAVLAESALPAVEP